MKIFAALLFTTAAYGALVAGCTEKRTPPSPISATPSAPVPAWAAPAPTEEVVREKRPRFGESVVYVDGQAVGVIRSTELPAKLSGRTIHWPGGYVTTSYGFLDYARALGIDAKRVKAMHLYGGRRVVVVDRAELTRVGDQITFAFVGGNRGKVRINWPSVKLNVNTTIDMASHVVFYVDKEPPVLKDGALFMPDGSPVNEKLPYAAEEQGSGTRVYVDGTLVGTVKRKKITDAMALEAPVPTDTASAKNAPTGSTSGRFSLLSYAAMLRSAARQAKSMDLVAGDDVIAHLDAVRAGSVAFNVPPHNHGQAVVDVPTPAGPRPARITAVQIYIDAQPPVRPVVDVDKAPEAALRQGQGQGQGSGSDSDDEL